MDNTNNLNAPDNDVVQNPAAGTEIKPTGESVVNSDLPVSVTNPEPIQNPQPNPVSLSSPIVNTDTPPLQPSTPQPFFGAPQPTATPASVPPTEPVKPKKSQKILFAGVIAAFLLIGGTAAAYLGVYLPNQPEQVWETSLNNTADGYDKLLAYEAEHKDLSTTKLSGDYRIEANSSVFDGTYSAETDAKKGKLAFDVGFMGSRIKLEALTEIKENTTYPDVYVRADGIDVFEPFVAGTGYEGLPTSVNNQWYFADHSLFDQMMAGSEEEEMAYDAEDVRALMQVVGEVNREYVFTTDPNKAVLENREFVAEETQEDRKTFHYKVGLHKENTKTYVKAVADKVSQTELYKGLAPDEEAFNVDGLLEDIEKLDTTQTADVWVDTKTKLIRTVRFSMKDSEDYVDVGLKYTGGSEFPFYVSSHAVDDNDVEADLLLTATLNTDENSVDINANIDTSDDSMTGYIKGTVVRSNDEVTFDTPADAKSVLELIGSVYGENTGGELLPNDDVLGISTPFNIFSN